MQPVGECSRGLRRSDDERQKEDDLKRMSQGMLLQGPTLRSVGADLQVSPYSPTRLRARRQGLETCPRAAHRLPDRRTRLRRITDGQGTTLTGNVSVPREPA
jgi:hypothetical protein